MPDTAAPLSPRLSRTFSLLGILPLGGFLLIHLMINASALNGPDAFRQAVELTHRVPALAVFEWCFVMVPLAIHGMMGLWMTIARRSLAIPRPTSPAIRSAVRATGVLTMAFVVTHLPELGFSWLGIRLGGGELATVLDRDLSSTWLGLPWRGVWYLAGTAAAAFHFVAGAWGLFSSFRPSRSRTWSRWAIATMGLALWIAAADAIVLRATGSALVGDPERRRPSVEPCPAPLSQGGVDRSALKPGP